MKDRSTLVQRKCQKTKTDTCLRGDGFQIIKERINHLILGSLIL
jgi:hypothetical protein